MSSSYWESSEESVYSLSSEGYAKEDDEDDECEGEDEEEEIAESRRLNNSREDLLDDEEDTQCPTEAELAAARDKCEEYTESSLYFLQERKAERRDIEEQKRKERIKSLIKAVKIIGASIVILLVLIGAVIVHNFIEKHRMRGMVFKTRIEKLPLELPPGKLQLRTYMHRVQQGQFDDFTPFIASSEFGGKLHVVTNVSQPYFNAYYVEHPEIRDVVMVTDDFFCSPHTCFYLTDSGKGTFFNNFNVLFRNLTYQLVEVPLPTAFRFIRAEYCSFFGNPACQIIVETNGTRSLALAIQRSRYEVPTVELMEESFHGVIVATQYSSEPERIITWDDGRVAVFLPVEDNLTTYIDDVDRDEIVEVLPLNEKNIIEHVHIVIVMKEQEDKTRVRIIALSPENKIVRRDELLIPAPPSAITALIHKSTFEICHLTRSQIECSVNLE